MLCYVFFSGNHCTSACHNTLPSIVCLCVHVRVCVCVCARARVCDSYVLISVVTAINGSTYTYFIDYCHCYIYILMSKEIWSEAPRSSVCTGFISLLISCRNDLSEYFKAYLNNLHFYCYVPFHSFYNTLVNNGSICNQNPFFL